MTSDNASRVAHVYCVGPRAKVKEHVHHNQAYMQCVRHRRQRGHATSTSDICGQQRSRGSILKRRRVPARYLFVMQPLLCSGKTSVGSRA